MGLKPESASGERAVKSRIWLPSAAVQLQERGPKFIAAVDGADWSEGVGFHRGFFSTFRIRSGKEVWFHFPFPTPVEEHGRQGSLLGVSLLWEAIDGASIHWIVLQHGGMDRMPLTERLTEPPSTPVPFDPPAQWREYYPAADRRLTEIPLEPPLPLHFGVQLCIGVRAAQSDGTIRFYGAGATFGQA